MLGRFGSREICDVTFKALTDKQNVCGHEFNAGQPVFVIDTATASNMEQASTTVYAQGGKGYNRLIAWEGEKTMTFTVTDALLSPLGLSVLTGAGIAKDEDVKHVHVTFDVPVDASGKGTIKIDELRNELGLAKDAKVELCTDTNIKPYATVLDNNGSIVDWVSEVALAGGSNADISVTATGVASKTIKVDFYVLMTTGATEVTIEPNDFGGYFYVEADTLYRNQDGKDMAATITFPKVKIQSAFTIAMAPTGDPSTFDFTMDAFPAYTYFNRSKKVVCDIVIVSGQGGDVEIAHTQPLETLTEDNA